MGFGMWIIINGGTMKVFKIVGIFLLLSCMVSSAFAETWYEKGSNGASSEWTKRSGDFSSGPVYFAARVLPPYTGTYDIEMWMTNDGHITATATNMSYNPSQVCSFTGTKRGTFASGTFTCNTTTQLYTWQAAISPSE